MIYTNFGEYNVHVIQPLRDHPRLGSVSRFYASQIHLSFLHQVQLLVMRVNSAQLGLPIARYHAIQDIPELESPCICGIAQEFTLPSNTLSKRLSGATTSCSVAFRHLQASQSKKRMPWSLKYVSITPGPSAGSSTCIRSGRSDPSKSYSASFFPFPSRWQNRLAKFRTSRHIGQRSSGP